MNLIGATEPARRGTFVPGGHLSLPLEFARQQKETRGRKSWHALGMQQDVAADSVTALAPWQLFATRLSDRLRRITAPDLVRLTDMLEDLYL
jgi:hypothetical protein